MDTDGRENTKCAHEWLFDISVVEHLKGLTRVVIRENEATAVGAAIFAVFSGFSTISPCCVDTYEGA